MALVLKGVRYHMAVSALVLKGVRYHMAVSEDHWILKLGFECVNTDMYCESSCTGGVRYSACNEWGVCKGDKLPLGYGWRWRCQRIQGY